MAKQLQSSRRAEVLPKQEELLLDYAERLARHLPGRRAVHLHLSALQPHNRRQQHIRIAANSCDSLVQRYDGQCFVLSNNDLVVVVRDAPIAQIDDVVLRLRYLFSDDPAVSQAESAEGETAPFCTWYELEQDHASFCAMARRMLEQAERHKPLPNAKATKETDNDGKKPHRPIDAEYLGRLVKAIETADLTSMLSRQQIAAIVPGNNIKPVFNEIYVSMDALRHRLAPDVDLFANRWLFQVLTEAVDLRLLRQLPALERQVPMSTSLNLNIATLMSEDFLTFDRELRQHVKKSMVIELQSIDVFGNIGSFHFLREFLRERDYKICLDGLSHLTFPLLQRNDIDVDFYKVIWSPELNEMEGSLGLARFREAIECCEPTHVVLSRCEDEGAITFGQKLGITLYQGHHIDTLLSPDYRAATA